MTFKDGIPIMPPTHSLLSQSFTIGNLYCSITSHLPANLDYHYPYIPKEFYTITIERTSKQCLEIESDTIQGLIDKVLVLGDLSSTTLDKLLNRLKSIQKRSFK